MPLFVMVFGRDQETHQHRGSTLCSYVACQCAALWSDHCPFDVHLFGARSCMRWAATSETSYPPLLRSRDEDSKVVVARNGVLVKYRQHHFTC
jgi:hypothetical protein